MSSAAPLEARLQAVMRSWPQPINPGCEHQLMRLIDRRPIAWRPRAGARTLCGSTRPKP
jgi:hypothetical protein